MQQPSGAPRPVRDVRPQGPETSLAEALRSLGDNLARLLSEHVALAQSELKREGARLLRAALLVGAGLLWAGVGYIGLMAAVVAALSPAMGVPLAALVVGGVNLVAGALALGLAAKRLSDREPAMPGLEAEIDKDLAAAGNELTAPPVAPN
jgi:uncharacterized membrane protein YqjE